MEIVVILVIMAAFVSALAHDYGRSGWGFFFLSLLCSPVLTVIILLCVGRTAESKAQQQLDIERQKRMLEDAE